MLNNRFLVILTLVLTLVFSGCKTTKPVASKPKPPKKELPQVVQKPEPGFDEIEDEIEAKADAEAKVEEKEPPVQPFKTSPYVMREFRAAWIATVANINWPSKSGLSTQQQQEEAIKLLDFLKDHNYNAVIFQARPQSDALYKSNLEPWSFFLTGETGKAPEPYYDPLNFWIEAAHDRGMELHVWLNPYRAYHSTGGPINSKSIVNTHPELVVKLKNGMYWLDPSKKGTQEHVESVIMDLVKRYDIDGVHMDDYFYPYASYNKGADFPDANEYSAYQKSGGKMSKPDWRRAGVNTFVETVYKEIKAEKPQVKFGISPFGIWRPGYPKSISGMDQYNELYADAKLWLNKGWLDYFTPQLYWKINQTAQSFPVLLGWWESENTQDRHLWPGINIDFGGDAANVDETINQIMLTRGMVAESKGTVHWSIAPLLKYPNLAKALVDGPYKKQALVPKSPWLDEAVPDAPSVSTKIEENRVNISWSHPELEDVANWVVYYKYGSNWAYKILDRTENSADFTHYLKEKEKKDPLTFIGVTSVDRTGNQSTFNEIKIEAK